MSEAKIKGSGLVPSLERGIAILRMFNPKRQEITAPMVASELGLPRSTVHRLLTCLAELDLLRAQPRSVFTLGAGILSLGFEYIASQDIVSLAQPILERLRDESDCSCHLAIRDGSNIVYLTRIASAGAVAGNVGVGTILPAHATIMGRLLLSDLEPHELNELYSGKQLEATGPQTPVTIAALRDLIESDRKRGFATSQGFFETGIGGVAVPIYDNSGRIVAAINAIVKLGEAAPDYDFEYITRQTIKAGNDISRMLGATRLNTNSQVLEVY